jgi:hypothetical protein
MQGPGGMSILQAWRAGAWWACRAGAQWSRDPASLHPGGLSVCWPGRTSEWGSGGLSKWNQGSRDVGAWCGQRSGGDHVGQRSAGPIQCPTGRDPSGAGIWWAHMDLDLCGAWGMGSSAEWSSGSMCLWWASCSFNRLFCGEDFHKVKTSECSSFGSPWCFTST